MYIGQREFPPGGRVYVMGILNVTPDSFSDGGKYDDLETAIRQAERLVEEGADILDVGGESTRPGYVPVSGKEEIQRTVPVIRELKKRFDVPVSIDTYKSEVAEAALDAGADLLNDIWGFRRDEECARLAAEYGAAVCLMHNRETAEYRDFVPEVIADLQISLAIADKYGIKKDKIILDPGVGFGKTLEQNRIIINRLEDIVALGYPVLLGASRKSVIGQTLMLPVNEREEGTIALSVIAAMKGCWFVRVHDVKKNMRALRMTDAVLHSESGRR